MGFSRQEYWSGLPFPSPGDLPSSGIKPASPARIPAFWFLVWMFPGEWGWSWGLLFPSDSFFYFLFRKSSESFFFISLRWFFSLLSLQKKEWIVFYFPTSSTSCTSLNLCNATGSPWFAHLFLNAGDLEAIWRRERFRKVQKEVWIFFGCFSFQ